MRRLMLLIAAGSLWLFLAAVPVFADGGPHVASVNNGIAGVNADSCAGCHRAHTAQGEYLLVASSATASCLTCHGSTGLGATTDVENGVQYALGTTEVRGGQVLGYLRGGGFVNARIGSGEVVRIGYDERRRRPPARQGAGPDRRVPARHLGPPAEHQRRGRSSGLHRLGQRPQQPDRRTPGRSSRSSARRATTRTGTAQYRILNPIPDPSASGTDGSCRPRPPAIVTDAALPAAGDTRNYTIIQTNGGTNTLPASQVAALNLPATAGDYWRRRVPWNWHVRHGQRRAERTVRDASTASTRAWCLTCHTRYLSDGLGRQDRRRDLHLSAHLDRDLPELRHVPRGAWFERPDDRVQLGHHGLPGRHRRTGRRQPAAQDRQPRHVPGLPRSDGDDRCRDSRSGRRPSRSSPSSDNLRGGRRRRPGHPQQPSTG